MNLGGGGAPENKLLRGKSLTLLSKAQEYDNMLNILGSKEEGFMIRKAFLLAEVILNLFQDLTRKSKKCHIDLPKQEGILRQEGRLSISCTNHAQNDMAFKIETNFCHPEDEIRRIFKKNEREILRFAPNDKRCAFTLAEVLITLGVIGIVAAMTLPTVINNMKNKQLESQLHRSYSVIAQALDRYQAETGERILPEKEVILKPLLTKYLQVIDQCGTARNPDNIAYTTQCLYYNSKDPSKSSQLYKTYSGALMTNLGFFDDGQFVLNDGSLVLLENPSHIDRIYITVDVNGINKNPNRFGHDLFMFQINEKGALVPMGAKGTAYYSDTDEYCSTTSSNQYNGAGCTYRALTEKDYFKNLPK